MNEERNKNIIKMREEGKSFVEIGETFGITRERVRKIYNKHKKRETLLETSELYPLIVKETDTFELASKIYYTLYRRGIETIDELKELSDEDIDKMVGVGPKMKGIIIKIRDTN